MNTQKGSILIFSVLMMGVILTITLSLANTLLPRLKSTHDALGSVAAIYAADSGVEWCLYTQRGKVPAVLQPTMSNGATFTILFGAGPGTCDPAENPLNHTVIGTFRTVTRAFQISQEDTAPPPPPPGMCNGLSATIVGTSNDETLNGTSGDDVIVGNGGNDTIDGGSGTDTICSGSGNDIISGGSNNDTIIDDGGNNNVMGGSGNDNITTGSGNDTIDGGSGTDSCNADGGNNTVQNCE